jgi:hypothetical protein
MVLSIARQGIHLNRTEKQQNRFITRQGIHLFSINIASPTGKGRQAVYVFLLIADYPPDYNDCYSSLVRRILLMMIRRIGIRGISVVENISIGKSSECFYCR